MIRESGGSSQSTEQQRLSSGESARGRCPGDWSERVKGCGNPKDASRTRATFGWGWRTAALRVAVEHRHKLAPNGRKKWNWFIIHSDQLQPISRLQFEATGRERASPSVDFFSLPLKAAFRKVWTIPAEAAAAVGFGAGFGPQCRKSAWRLCERKNVVGGRPWWKWMRFATRGIASSF